MFLKLKNESKYVILLGLTSILLLFYNHLSWHNLVKVNFPHIHNINQSQVELSASHLWFEELISGDLSIEVDEVWQGLDRTDLLIQQILQGGKSKSGLDVIAVDDVGSKADLIKLQSLLSEFRLITHQRWENKTESQVGSELDQRFDATYRQAILLAKKLDNEFQQQSSAAIFKQDILHAIIVLIWIIISFSFTRRIEIAITGHDNLRHALVRQKEKLEESVYERTAELRLKAQELESKNKLLHNEIAMRAESEHQLRIAETAFESQEGMLVTDANSVILRVNHAFTNITGYSAEEAVGQTPRLLSSGKHDKTFFMTMWQSINNTGAWDGEIWNRRKNGEISPEYLTISVVRDANNDVTNYVATLTDITMSKTAADEIKNLAFYDPLTQLPNRRLLLDRLNQALAASSRSGRRGALLFLDLDHFKTLNDTMGHDMGDLLLQQMAARLTACVREGDTVSRLGGDEFVVLLEDLSEQDFEAAAQTKDVTEKILLALNKPYQLNTRTHHCTTSIGAVLLNGNEQAPEELLKQADIAMYKSKADGRNTSRFFDPMMQATITARADMEQELRKAIEHNQLQLHYQIQVDSTGQAFGTEAIIRWQHPERGMISPCNFIPLAEETGLIVRIGEWVLNTACAQLKIWQQTPLTQDLALAVNVSAKQFFQVDFVEHVLATIQRHDINPSRLKLELTESMLVDNINDVITKMNALSKIGIRFSLDDFGTGYSSLQYLKRLPLDQLKIDQSFVRNIVTDVSDKAIVRTIISMAHSLDINVIAEGVETAEQRQYLLDNDCTHYQGYLFSKPVPIGEFESLLGKI